MPLSCLLGLGSSVLFGTLSVSDIFSPSVHVSDFLIKDGKSAYQGPPVPEGKEEHSK